MRVARFFIAALTAAFLQLLSFTSAQADPPNWRYVPCVSGCASVKAYGDEPAIGLRMAREHFLVMWPSSYPPTTCYRSSSVITTCRKQTGVITRYGQALLDCGTGYERVGYRCVKKHGVNQGAGTCRPTEANPVAVESGTKLEKVTDFTTAGPQPLEFIRTYDSNTIVTTTVGRNGFTRFGKAWRTAFDSSAVYTNATPGSPANNDRVNIIMPDGREMAFIYNASLTTWIPAYFKWASPGTRAWMVPRTDVDMAFAISGSEALLTMKNDDVWAYNFLGQLVEIRYKSGYTQTLSYTGTNNTSIADNLGRTLTFTYNGDNLLDTMTVPDGSVYKYSYLDMVPDIFGPGEFALHKVIYPDATPLTDADNPRVEYHYEDVEYPYALTGITDERGVRYATWTYDDDGRIINSQHAGGEDEYTFSYDDVNLRTTVTNPLGKQTVYHFQDFLNRKRITKVEGVSSANCAASDTVYAYDTNGFVNQQTDGEGRITKFTNNARGLPTTIIEGFGTAEERTTALTWHSSINKPTQVVAPRVTSDLIYDSAGDLTDLTLTDTTSHSLPYSTNGQTRGWVYTYSAEGLLLTVDGPLAGTSDTVTYDYDANGFIDTITDEVGHVTGVISKNANGQPLTIRDENGVDTVMTYDERQRVKTITVNPGGSPAVTSFDYDEIGNIERITKPDGSTLDYTYDDARRLTEAEDNTGAKIEYDYDDMGNETSRTIRAPSTAIVMSQTQTFDELGRLLNRIGAAAQTTIHGYDKTDNLKTVTDPRSNIYAYAYDALSRLIRETDQVSAQVNYGLDSQDNVATYSDPRSLVTTYVRNGFGEAIQETSPDTGTTVYQRDARGLVTQMTDARSIVTNLTYDAAGRMLTRTYPAATAENITYTWDSIAGGNKGIGRLTSLADETGATSFVYDARGNIESDTRVIGSNTYAVGYDYDATDAVIEIVYPSGRIVMIARDALGQVSGITTKKNSVSSSVTIASSVAHAPMADLLTGFTYGNGLVFEAEYDQDYRFEDLRVKDGGTSLISLSYAWGDDINLTGITDNITSGNSVTLAYSAANRLASATGPWGSLAWTYDGVGNRLTETLGVTTDTLNYPLISNKPDTITQSSITVRTWGWDNAGNLISDVHGSNVYDFDYNKRNRLVSVTNTGGPPAPSGAYGYNALEQLVTRTLSSPLWPTVTVEYIYDSAGHLIAEADAATGDTLREYIWLDDRPAAVVTDIGLTTPTIWFVHADHLERPIA